MATLRDPLFTTDLNLSAQKQQQLEVANMGGLRRGWESGRIGNELNPLYTEELQAGIDGDETKRLGLRARIDGLRQRQAMYAPEVQRVEDIHGVGDGLGWAAGQVGQGVASMVDPMAVSAGLATAGRIAGGLPGIGKGLGYAAQGAALAVPYFMNRDQLRGEFIGDAQDDPELMARTSPQALMDKAGTFGSLAAIPDSALPGIVGRQVSGLSRAGNTVARQSAMGPGLKTLGGMALEGGTEGLQAAGSQYAQGQLNPNRDTSGDRSELINSFAGGAVGGGPFAAAGAYAEAGHNRLDAGVDAVKGAAGDVVDLVNDNPTVQAGVTGAKKLWGSAKDKVGSTIDLASDDNGKASATALVENLKAGGMDPKSRAQTALDEHRLLSGVPPDDIVMDTAKAAAWLDETSPKRTALVASKLAAMGDDPQALALRAGITGATDHESSDRAVDAAAEFLLAKTPMGRVEERAASLGESLGKIAGVVGPALGRGAVATGKAALGFGKSVLSGVQDGLRKKNEQAAPADETFGAWRDRYYGVQGQQAAAQALASADPVVTQRADLAGSYAEDMAARTGRMNMKVLSRHNAFALADMVNETDKFDPAAKVNRLNRITTDFQDIYGQHAPEVLRQLGAILGPNATPAVAHMVEQLTKQTGPGGRQVYASERDALATQVVSLVDPEAQNKLMKQGVNLNTPRGREQLLGIMEDFADGVGSASGMRKALENTFGAESVQGILTLLNGMTTEREPDVLLNEVSDQDTKEAEKNFAKGVGQKVYGFSKAPNLRTSSERHDMFGAMDDPDEDGALQRPQLFAKGQKLFGGADAIEKKIADVRKQLLEDPEYPDHDNHRVEAKSAHDVMTEAGMQSGKIMQLYRDYMRMDAKDEKKTEGERRYAHQQARLANSAVVDSIQKKDADGKMQKQSFKLSAGERSELRQAAEAYFKERYMVVGEQLSNQDTGKISLPDILNLHKDGQGLIERARKADAESGEQGSTALSDANVLMFRDSKDPKKTFAIPAGKLVNWVKQARGKMTESDAEDTIGSYGNKAKDEAYLADVMEGIATLIGSGHVAGLPYKVNKFGKVESFNGGVPDSLRLATKTYGALAYGTKTRREKRGRIGNEAFQGADQEAVAKALAKEVALSEASGDEEVSADHSPASKRPRPRGRMYESREAAAADVGRTEASEDKLDAQEDDKTPLDHFPKAKGVPDEYANQRWLSTQTGATTDSSPGPEPKGTAASSAEFRAGKITEAFISDPAKGQEMIRMRIRAAMAPEYNVNQPERGKLTVPGVAGKDQVAGGVHYIAPVAYFTSAENIGKNNLDLPAATIAAIQSKVANLLLKGEISKEEKVKIARLMFKGTDTKVTAMNVDGVLGRLTGLAVQSKAMVTKTREELGRMENEYLTREQNSDATSKPNILSTAIAKRQAYLDNPPADYSTEQAKAVASWAKTQLERVLAEKSDDPDRQDQLSGYKHDLLRLQQKAASVLEGDASLKDLEGTAPEVANAGLPKDRATLSGGSERKLNAQGAEPGPQIHSSEFKEWYGDWTRRTSGVRSQDGGRNNRGGDTGGIPTAGPDTAASFLGGTGPTGPDGKPFIYYHGSRDDISYFVRQHRRQKDAGWLGRGVYLTSDPDLAHDYARVKRRADGTDTGVADQNVMPLYAAVKNPYFATYDEKVALSRLGEAGTKAFTKRLKSQGYDGVVLNFQDGRQELVAFEPGDVKSAVGNNGEFSRDDSRINHNAQEGNAKVSTQAERDAAIAYALKTLGPKIKVDFKDITGYSGEFLDAQNVIEISTTAAAGTLNTLYHEAMHVFFRDFVKGNPKLQAVFETLINDPKHLAKLTSLLDGYPAAQAQLTSGEERLAYTYQFWKAGLLQVDTKAHTWLQKLGKFFRHVLGRVRDSERALELFEAFDNGKMSEPSAAGMVIAKAMGRGTNAMKARRAMDGMLQGLAAATIPAGEILGRSVSPTARKLSAMMFTNPGEEAHGSEQIGMMNARRNVAQQYTNVSNRRFETMSEVDKAAVQKYLQSGVEPHTIADKEQREAVADIRHLLDRFHKYMTDAGLKIGKIDNYYPVVWNPNVLNANKQEFVQMLVTKYAAKMGASNPHKAAERIWQSLVDKEGVDAHLPAGREDGVLSPFFASQEMRTLPWLDAADREKYLDKNMPLTLTRYFSQGAHATEYFRRFGENGKRMEKMLMQIRQELSHAGAEMVKRGEIKDEPARVKWVSRQMRDISQSVGAMEGSLGKDVSPSMRTFNSWMAVYQNIRLLPMALFSSLVDPLAMVARGAPLQAAYETFVYGMREVFRGWADAFKDMPPERQKDEWRQLAEHIGASEIAMFQHHVSDEYSSTYMTPGAKKLNDKMFTFNGMEAWNRGSRIMATKWAVRFIEKHASLPDKNHSERWLKELGLQPSQIVMDDGKLVTSPQQLAVLKGISLDDARERISPIHDALNRWVEGAVLTPNAAQRPAWSSDPNWASLFHLKQFSYSFHQTILKRATNEFSHGNMAPLGALALFIPTMITSDIIKGLIQGGGSLPPYMASMNAGDWFMHGTQRAGLSGIGVIGMDAAADWSSLGGPAFEQIVDAARDGFGSKSALKAMPLNSLYGQLAA